MQVSALARANNIESLTPDARLQQVAALLHRISSALGAEGCGWLTDIVLLDPGSFGSIPGLTLTRLSQNKTLLSYSAGTSAPSLTKEDMEAIAAYQRAAWTPSAQKWPLTAWSKTARDGGTQTTVCIPLHGPTGTSSVVFVPLGANVVKWYETALMFVGPLLEAEQELRLVFLENAAPRSALNGLEIESLQWAARGKTAWESARIQGIPERTVVQRLKRAREKLGATSTALAIGIATQLKIIDAL